MISYKLTKEEFTTIAPFYKRSLTASQSSYSAPLSKSDFELINEFLKAHGFSPPTNYACSSCVLWGLKVLYQFFMDPSNTKLFKSFEKKNLLG